MADAGPHERIRNDRAQRPAAANQGSRLDDPLLSFASERSKTHLAGVAIESHKRTGRTRGGKFLTILVETPHEQSNHIAVPTLHAFDYLAAPQSYPPPAVVALFGDEPFLKRL